jgi:hypothetical protein
MKKNLGAKKWGSFPTLSLLSGVQIIHADEIGADAENVGRCFIYFQICVTVRSCGDLVRQHGLDENPNTDRVEKVSLRFEDLRLNPRCEALETSSGIVTGFSFR